MNNETIENIQPINYFSNTETNTKDCCAICLNTLDEHSFTIPECSHKFHSNCLLSWFRSNTSCPTCRGNFRKDDLTYSQIKTRFRMLSNYSRRKNANKYVVNMFKRYKKRNTMYKKCNKEISIFKKKYKNIISAGKKLKRNKYHHYWELKKIKNEILSIPIIPLKIYTKC
jgi:hypothetical protein